MSKKKKRKNIRFKTIKIKVSSRQKKSLENFCKARKTTPNKIIKKSIRPLLENYMDLIPSNNTEKIRQLNLFAEE
jgi:hypothetical protein